RDEKSIRIQQKPIKNKYLKESPSLAGRPARPRNLIAHRLDTGKARSSRDRRRHPDKFRGGVDSVCRHAPSDARRVPPAPRPPGPIDPHRAIHFHYTDIYGLPEY
ncbi:hypothetical protein, partial [Burkholderia contaminans]|uniref:hypothetical protein n=1 Tax=Burkholderia contaminans TaxID=488447 RepID=UPI002D7F3F51